MIKLILHGDNQTASRNNLNGLVGQYKEKDFEIVRIDGEKSSLTDFLQALETVSLFGQERLIVVENLFTRQKSNERGLIIEYLAKNAKTFSSVILWERKLVGAVELRKLSSYFENRAFKIPIIVFRFIDSFVPSGKMSLLNLLSGFDNDSLNFAFNLLVYRISQLIVVRDIGPEKAKLSGWQKQKILTQADKFSLKKLVKLYKNMLKIDNDIKTGNTLMDLKWHFGILTAGI